MKKILSIGLICLLLNYSIGAYCAYQETLLGEGMLETASPEIRLIYVTSPIEVFRVKHLRNRISSSQL